MIKSIINQNTDVVTTKLKEIWLVLRRGSFFWGGLFAVCEGRVGMGKKKEKHRRRGLAEWWYIHFYQWIHQRTTSVVDSLSNSDGELVTSLYGDLNLNFSVIPSIKSPAKTSTSTNRLFFIMNIPSVILLLYFDRSIPSIYTNRITNIIVFVGNYHSIYRQNYSIDNSVGFKPTSTSDLRVYKPSKKVELIHYNYFRENKPTNLKFIS